MAAQILQRERYHTCYYCKLVACMDQMLPAEVLVAVGDFPVHGSIDQECSNLKQSPA